MNINLDENLSSSAKTLLSNNGFDVLTVSDQNISGIAVENLFQLIRSEGRCFITLDKDFSDTVALIPISLPTMLY
jgi:predicted nuclease of predicted toxin-antitoxin system